MRGGLNNGNNSLLAFFLKWSLNVQCLFLTRCACRTPHCAVRSGHRLLWAGQTSAKYSHMHALLLLSCNQTCNKSMEMPSNKDVKKYALDCSHVLMRNTDVCFTIIHKLQESIPDRKVLVCRGLPFMTFRNAYLISEMPRWFENDIGISEI